MHMASGRSSGSGFILKLSLPGLPQWLIQSSRPPSQRRVRDGISPSSLLQRFRYLLPPYLCPYNQPSCYRIDSIVTAGWPFSVM